METAERSFPHQIHKRYDPSHSILAYKFKPLSILIHQAPFILNRETSVLPFEKWKGFLFSWLSFSLHLIKWASLYYLIRRKKSRFKNKALTFPSKSISLSLRGFFRTSFWNKQFDRLSFIYVHLYFVIFFESISGSWRLLRVLTDQVKKKSKIFWHIFCVCSWFEIHVIYEHIFTFILSHSLLK